jgi:hypothetical protein
MSNSIISIPKILIKHTFLIFVIILSLIFQGCKSSPHYEADISDVKIPDVEIRRYEQLLFSVNPFTMLEDIEPYADEFSFFLGDAIYTEAGQAQLYDYITDPFVQEIWEDTNESWENVSDLEKDLTLAFRYFRYYFPSRELPTFYSYVSGLDYEQPVKYIDNNVIIGLDMFLGAGYKNYERVRVPAFKRIRFTEDAVPVEVFRAIAEDMILRGQNMPETFLDFIVHEGKILYFFDCMLPGMNDSLKISYTGGQLDWATRNQGQAWAFYLDNEMFYSTDRQLIQKFIGAAPFTAPFSRGSAPRMGSFTGWQIVREYMRRNPEVTLTSLFYEKNAREILTESRYRP